LNRTILSVNFNTLVDSALGQTNKNIVSLFREIDNLYAPSKYLILFDEIDALALDRINSNDVREMGRATSTLLKCLDSLNSKVLLIATTNLYDQLDKALARRFDATISFDNYSVEDKAEIANNLVTYYQKGNSISKDERLLTKIITLTDKPFPDSRRNEERHPDFYRLQFGRRQDRLLKTDIRKAQRQDLFPG
jgi:SpoVK/Ycf46/Vps4 family AAA+-type ATPase